MRTATIAALVLLAAVPLAAQQTLLDYHGDFHGDQFGSVVAMVGNVNSQAGDDILVGCPEDDTKGLDAGAVYVISGQDGSVIRVHYGAAPGDRFGSSVLDIYDQDGDGKDEYMIGAPLDDADGTDAGRVYFYSGTGSLFGTIESPAAGIRFGSSLADFGYVGDSFLQMKAVAIGAPYADGPAGTDCGAFYVRYIDGLAPSEPPTLVYGQQAGEHYGATMNGTWNELIVGAPDFDGGVGANSGRIETWLHTAAGSSPSAKFLWALGGNVAGGHFGAAVAVVHWKTTSLDHQFAAGAPGAATPYVWIYGDNAGVPQPMATLTGSGGFGSSIVSGRLDNLISDPGYVAIGSPDALVGGVACGHVTVWQEGVVDKVFDGTHPQGRFGAALGGKLGLYGAAGNQNFVIGAPGADVNVTDDGWIEMHDGYFDFDTEVSRSQPPGPGDGAGRAVAGIGDVNGDGVPDVLVGSPDDDLVQPPPFPAETIDCGSARVLSGADGSIVRSHYGAAGGDELGWSLAALGDVDLDGVVDYVVGAPQRDNPAASKGYARVYSGDTGSLLFTLNGAISDDEFGFAVGGGSDLNGDGRRDILVGAPGTTNGTAYFYSGANGFLIGGVNGAAAGDRFASSLAGLGDDVNGDGKDDWIVGAPDNDATQTNAGRAYVMTSLLTFTPKWIANGVAANDHLGTSVAADGDVNGDGTVDVLVGAPDYDSVSTDAGRVTLQSGVNGALIAQVRGSGDSDEFGTAVAGLGDIDGDGLPDWAGGAKEPGVLLTGAGYVKVVSGKDNFETLVLDGGFGESLGTSVANAGDLDGDGTNDVLAGGPSSDADGVNSGVARVLSLPTGASPWTDLGFALAGVAGNPQLTGTGTLVAGSAGALTLGHAAPSALAYLFISVTDAPTSFKGGQLVPVPPILTVIVVTSATGDLQLPWAAWPTGLSGLDLFFQYAIQDAAAIKGTALSNALKAHVP